MRHIYRCHRSYIDLDETEQGDDAEGSFFEASRLDAARGGAAFDDTEWLSSSCFVENVSNARGAACSASIRSSSTVHDLALKVKREICLLLFRVAEVHKLSHSVTE